MQKLIAFDENTKDLIIERALDVKIVDIQRRLDNYLGVSKSDYYYESLNAKERALRGTYINRSKLSEIVNKATWTDDDAKYIADCYDYAVTNFDITSLSIIVNGLHECQFGKYINDEEEDTKEAYLYYGYFSETKIAKILNCFPFDYGSEKCNLLRDLKDYLIVDSSYSLDISETITVARNSLGLVFSINHTNGVETNTTTQRMIWTEEGLSNSEKYERLEEIKVGVNEYRLYLKDKKDANELNYYTKLQNNVDFKENAIYVESQSLIFYDSTYEFVNGNANVRANASKSHASVSKQGYEYMTESQVAIYNYLYNTKGKDEAEKYLTLLKPSLRAKLVEKTYDGIKDKNFIIKALFEYGATLENFGTNISNFFAGINPYYQGENEDADGYMLDTANTIVSSAIIENENNIAYKTVYKGAMIAGELTPGLVMIYCAGGLGAMSLLGTGIFAASYAAEIGGRTYSSDMNEGYTWSQSTLNATVDATEEAAKVVAFSKLAEITGPSSECITKSQLLQNALKMAGVTAIIEEADGEIVTPLIDAVTLSDTDKLEVNHAEVAKNSAIAAGMAGVAYTLSGLKEFDNVDCKNEKINLNSDGIGNNINDSLSEGTIVNTSTEHSDAVLPNVDDAYINPKKLTEYALNPNHPVGGNKARVFESSLGYNQSNADDLLKEIYQKLPQSEAIIATHDQYGQRYTVDMMITGPNGNTVKVRTGWIIKTNSEIPELTTIYVKE